MTHEYDKPVTPSSGLRLHLNENTLGCSPKVLETLRAFTCTDAAFYPDYTRALEACARYLGVTEDKIQLTNGLDEGILAVSVASLRGAADSPNEAVVVVPAFDMYAATADAVGGRVVEVAPLTDFRFPLDGVLAALGTRTRLVFLTNPNNPTGLTIPPDAIFAIADAAPQATIFLDEAYAEFSGTSLIGDPRTHSRRNIVIGRTFAKAYGLAALRVGALVAHSETLAPIRRIVPPYSVNAAAAAALPAALSDPHHFESYLRETAASKQLLYSALDKLNVPYWRSETNFVFARLGDDAQRIVGELRKRDIYVRDRSSDPACRGCVRITTGSRAHTQACIDALEEVLCGAR